MLTDPALVNAQCAASRGGSILSESFGGQLEVSFRSASKLLKDEAVKGGAGELPRGQQLRIVTGAVELSH